MMTKVATCCYCGTRAALVLEGQVRHELSCASCGAPLSRLKMLPTVSGKAPAPAATPARPTTPRVRHGPSSKPKKRKKTIRRKILGEVWDLLDDIFD